MNTSSCAAERVVSQSGDIHLPTIYLPVNVNLKITIDPEVKALAEKILSRLPYGNETSAEIVSKVFNSPTVKFEPDEPRELSVSIPDDLIEAPRRPIDPQWNTTSNVEWRETGKDLIIRHKGCIVWTTWETMERLASMTEKPRLNEIRGILGKFLTPQKRDVYNQFAGQLRKGEIKRPCTSLPEDIDAPMLAGLNLTRIKEDCGKGEELN